MNSHQEVVAVARSSHQLFHLADQLPQSQNVLWQSHYKYQMGYLIHPPRSLWVCRIGLSIPSLS